MEREKRPKHFIQQPEYPGGPKELTKFIYQNLRYPAAAVAAKIEGTVYIEYDIDYKGNVVDTRVLQGLGHGCDEEAARVLRLLKFSVGRNRGVRVLFHKKANIKFKLPVQAKANAQAPAPPGNVVQYTYQYSTQKSAEPAAEKAPEKSGTTYSYTITIGGNS
ncbi:MAG: energy transducer TonB [Lewinellaceae bacterium]|nr:energy transducer TonB [Saprospiraceae bacterium]MCB9334019.1 energy transducer TonB [Lewinellaceae bacterium]